MFRMCCVTSSHSAKPCVTSSSLAGGVDPISYVHKKETRERDHAHLVENNECRARRLDGPRERPAVVKIRRSPERDFERILNGGDRCELAMIELARWRRGGRYLDRLNQRDATPASNLPVSINHLYSLDRLVMDRNGVDMSRCPLKVDEEVATESCLRFSGPKGKILVPLWNSDRLTSRGSRGTPLKTRFHHPSILHNTTRTKVR